MMRRAALLLPLLVLAGSSLGVKCYKDGSIVQKNASIAGVIEPNTPGAPGVVAPQKLVDLLGPDPDLNRVSYVRTFRRPEPGPGFERPDIVIILIPGFLGGATTFDPLARDLVKAGDGRITVWAVDRRPNQLEDQLGGKHAVEGSDQQAIFEGAQFYFADLDRPPTGDFPGPTDLDLNLNGAFDGQTPLEDGFGVTRLPILFTQDDVRPFAAHWGVDLYMRDWKLLVEKARNLVGEDGLVLFGGHSQGTSWTARFAAYDFDPGPGVKAGYSLVDGLILLEGGGLGPPSSPPPTQAEYLAALNELQTPGGPDIFLDELFPGLALTDLGTIGQVAAIAGVLEPDEPALIQRTSVLGNSIIGLLLAAPATNQAVAGFFLDDDYSANPAFRAGLGFSDNGPNNFIPAPLNPSEMIYIPLPAAGGEPRTWRNSTDPNLLAESSCPPKLPTDGTGCAFNFNVNPGDDEVTDINDFLRTQYEVNNGFEWYFLSGRVSLDFSYGNDSSSLGDESLLAVTQTANMNAPVLGIGGDNGLAPTEASFATYFGTIATPDAEKKACILPGYAHVDPLTATDNLTVGLVLAFIDALEGAGSVDDTVICPGELVP